MHTLGLSFLNFDENSWNNLRFVFNWTACKLLNENIDISTENYDYLTSIFFQNNIIFDKLVKISS